MTITVRHAVPHDAAAIAVIYNHGIRGRQATFETAERTASDVLPWFEPEQLARFPVLVANY